MYTGGVSSLAEQIANQLQRKEQPKTLLDKKELVRDIPGALALVMALRGEALACSEGLTDFCSHLNCHVEAFLSWSPFC